MTHKDCVPSWCWSVEAAWNLQYSAAASASLQQIQHFFLCSVICKQLTRSQLCMIFGNVEPFKAPDLALWLYLNDINIFVKDNHTDVYMLTQTPTKIGLQCHTLSLAFTGGNLHTAFWSISAHSDAISWKWGGGLTKTCGYNRKRLVYLHIWVCIWVLQFFDFQLFDSKMSFLRLIVVWLEKDLSHTIYRFYVTLDLTIQIHTEHVSLF